MESYTQQKERHQDEFGKLEGIFYAFNNEQFKEGMEKVGLTEKDVSKIYSMGGTGGYIKKENMQALKDLWARHEKERTELKANNKELFNALVYELKNHEYGYTGDYSDALDALGLDYETLDKVLLKRACKKAIADCEA